MRWGTRRKTAEHPFADSDFPQKKPLDANEIWSLLPPFDELRLCSSSLIAQFDGFAGLIVFPRPRPASRSRLSD